MNGSAPLLATAGTLGLLAVLACESNRIDDRGGWGPTGGGCEQFMSCESCTPVSGCGWCFDSNGVGQCASDPDGCETPAFSWTWNPDGCRVAADAGAARISSGDGDTNPVVDPGVVQPVDAALARTPDAAPAPALDAAIDASTDGAYAMDAATE